MRKAEAIKTVIIAGAGTIGTAVAQIFALYGYDVVLYDIEKKSIERSHELLWGNSEKRLEQGKETKEGSQEMRSRITFTQDKSAFKNADYVVESIFEDMGIKQAFWREISAIVPEDIILATNTSGLSISEIAKAVHLPGRFAGMHWSNPAYLLPLVEIIAGKKTDPEVVDIIYDLCVSMHRRPIRVKDAPGFVFNRLQFAVLREAIHIVESGIASIEDVDNVMKSGLGARYASVGPFETADLGGLDTFYKISGYLSADLCNDKAIPKMLAGLYKNGDYGIKTGKGFYEYPEDFGLQKIEKRDELMTRLSRELYKDL